MERFVERSSYLSAMPVAVVIGCGDMGIGAARELGRDHPLFLVDIHGERVELAAEKLRSEGYSASGHRCDITDPDQTSELGTVLSAGPGVKVLAHVAGVGPAVKDWRTVFAVELIGPHLIARAVGPHMRKGGVAIFVASIARFLTKRSERIESALDDPLDPGFFEALASALGGEPTPAESYNYAKLGVMRMAEHLAVAWGEREVRALIFRLAWSIQRWADAMGRSFRAQTARASSIVRNERGKFRWVVKARVPRSPRCWHFLQATTRALSTGPTSSWMADSARPGSVVEGYSAELGCDRCAPKHDGARRETRDQRKANPSFPLASRRSGSMPFLRIYAHKARDVSVAASDFWDVLLDWGALMDWIPKLHEDPPAPVSGCEMPPGQSIANLPCTRRVYLENGGIGPAYLDETLRHFDPETRRLYYTFEGVGPGGVRNYHATTYVDETGPATCRVTCASQFDIAADAQTDMKAFIEAFYEIAIIGGIAKLAMQRIAAQRSAEPQC